VAEHEQGEVSFEITTVTNTLKEEVTVAEVTAPEEAVDARVAAEEAEATRVAAEEAEAARVAAEKAEADRVAAEEAEAAQEEEVLVPVLPITHTWAGRQFHFSDVTLNGASNAAIVVPGQSIDVSLQFRTSWKRSPDDYCPGCVVQLYYGLGSASYLKHGQGGFSKGVKSGIRDMRHSEGSQTTFEAPTEPGVYYITWEISLEYDFISKNHNNDFKNAIAMVRVLPKSEWTAAMLAPFVTNQTRSLILAFLLYCSNESDTEANKMQSIPNGVAQKIAAYIMVSSYEEMTQADQ